MRVALDISSTKSDHRFRGIGFYTLNLWKNLKIIALKDPSIELVTFNKQVPNADLYHFPAFNPFFLSFPLNLINKSIITIHDLIPIEYPQHYPAGIKGSIKWQIQKILLKKSRAIITDSNYSADSIYKQLKYPKDKTHVIHLAAGEYFQDYGGNYTKTADSITRLSPPPKYVLYVGDLNWNKNVTLLAKSCVQLGIPLVVVGKQAVNTDIDRKHPWNRELAEFQDYAQANEDLIIRYGYVSQEDLVLLYNLAQVYVQPSITEGFGLPIIEAFACGCLVLSSNAASLPEIAEDAALYFNPLDKEDLKRQLEYVWDNKNIKLLEKYRNLGLEQAKKFSWDNTAKQTWELYKKYL